MEFKIGAGEIVIQGETRDDGTTAINIHAVLNSMGVIGEPVEEANIGPLICTMVFKSGAHARRVYEAIKWKADVSNCVWQLAAVIKDVKNDA